MRPSPGSVTFVSAFALSLLLIVSSSIGLLFLILVPDLLKGLDGLLTNPWWFHYGATSAEDSLAAAWRIGATIAAACLGCASAFRGLRIYRNSSSPIVPFVIIFLLSLSLECLSSGTALLYASDGSIGLGTVLTRTIYWGRFVGLLGLLIAGLFCIELKYRKVMVLAGVVFLMAFAMVVYIPIDRTVFLAQLVWKLGDEQGVWFVNLMLGLLIVGTSAAATITRHDRRFLWLTASFALFLFARELLFFALHPLVLAIGLASLAGGAVLCLNALSAMNRAAGEKTGR